MPLNPPSQGEQAKLSYTREQVACHKRPEDCWIIVDAEVYDVTSWLRRHPGGSDVLQHYGGEDASVSLAFFHNEDHSVTWAWLAAARLPVFPQ